jgi:hypothetical protein
MDEKIAAPSRENAHCREGASSDLDILLDETSILWCEIGK